MKKTIAALSLCCVSLFSILLYQHISAPAVSASQALTQQPQPKYLVRVSDGVLAVYPYGSDTAVEVTDIRLASLREYDQKLIQQGFPLYSDRDLTIFLEDFDS